TRERIWLEVAQPVRLEIVLQFLKPGEKLSTAAGWLRSHFSTDDVQDAFRDGLIIGLAIILHHHQTVQDSGMVALPSVVRPGWEHRHAPGSSSACHGKKERSGLLVAFGIQEVDRPTVLEGDRCNAQQRPRLAGATPTYDDPVFI